MRRLTAERVSDDTYHLGEGPRWDGQRLCWVDIMAGRLLVADWQGGKPVVVDTHTVDRPLGAVAPAAGGGWVAAAGRGFGRLSPTGSLTMVAETEPESNRMNDAGCDPAGRFVAGSMAYSTSRGAGGLHRLEPDGTVTTLVRRLTIANGPAWSPDRRTMYLNDSGAGVTFTYDYDVDSGEVGTRRRLVQPDSGKPDGIAVDHDGGVWIALNGAGLVLRYTPRGVLDTVVELPVRQPTACCFVAGTLLVTTSYEHMDQPGPHDGALFAVDAGVTGPPVAPFAG